MSRSVLRATGVVVFLLCGCLLPACAAPRTGLGQTRPPDFALGLTVHASDADGASFRPEDDPEQVRRALRPARYVIEADGLLRAAFGPGVREALLPPITRRLTPAQLDRVWDLALEAGVLDPGPEHRIGTDETFRGAGDRVVVTSYAARGGARVYGAWVLDGEASAEGVEALLDELAALSWVSE